MPGRQFSSPAWFWNELCQNWTLSTKGFDVDESVNSNKNLFSQNFSDQCYFLLLPSIFTDSQTFCVAPGEGLPPGPSRLPTPVPSLQAQPNRGTRLLGSSVPRPHGTAAPCSSTATSNLLHPQPSSLQTCVAQGALPLVAKVPLPAFHRWRS